MRNVPAAVGTAIKIENPEKPLNWRVEKMKLSKDIGKVGVMVGVCDGFVGNRMLYYYRKFNQIF